jgi:hypothetical protein
MSSLTRATATVTVNAAAPLALLDRIVMKQRVVRLATSSSCHPNLSSVVMPSRLLENLKFFGGLGECVVAVEIDEATDEYVTFAAHIAGISKGQVIARLVAQARSSPDQENDGRRDQVAIHADYVGHRTHARFISPGRVEVVDGPLAGTAYRSPSEAARAVVANYKPTVSPHRNGWSFWILTASGDPLQTLRRHVR